MTKSEEMRRYRQRYPEKALFDHARARATRKRIPFTITVADVKRLLDAGWECSYCSTPVGSFTGGQRPLSATLDRLIPELGYAVGNVVLACHACNSAKSEHTPASLRAWADRIDSIITRMNPKETHGT